MVSLTIGMGSLPAGKFGEFGPCVLKFLRLSDNFEYVDQTEYLIHANNPTNLVYTISGTIKFFNYSIQKEKMALDFNFFEACTITVFIQFGMKDNEFLREYLLNTRDAHRGLDHSVFVLIAKLAPHHTIRPFKFLFRVQFRIFIVDLKITHVFSRIQCRCQK